MIHKSLYTSEIIVPLSLPQTLGGGGGGVDSFFADGKFIINLPSHPMVVGLTSHRGGIKKNCHWLPGQPNLNWGPGKDPGKSR